MKCGESKITMDPTTITIEASGSKIVIGPAGITMDAVMILQNC